MVKVNINGNYAFSTINDTLHPQAVPAVTGSVPAGAIPDLDGIANTLLDLGQDILIGAGAVMIVAVGIAMIVGLKREGWKGVVNVIQGLGIGLIGPSALAVIAKLFVAIAAIL